MKHRKRIFLGGYLNSMNAQNFNCLALAKYLDSNEFEVYSMLYPNGGLPTPDLPGCKLLKCRRPMKLFVYWAYLWGILHCDIAYLPKLEVVPFTLFWAKLLRRKCFFTMEGLADEIQLARVKNKTKYLRDLKLFSGNIFAISPYIRAFNQNRHAISFRQDILYLGVDSKLFVNEAPRSGKLERIIFIGNQIRCKGISDFLALARQFPHLEFHVVGGNDYDVGITLEEFLAREHFANVIYHGRLDHPRLAVLLKKMDLLFFPSRSEGFPKVTLESSCAGVPAIVYSDYGAHNWITSGYNGFVVKTLSEVADIVKRLCASPDELKTIASHSVELGKSFAWSSRIKEWEDAIRQLLQERR